MNESPIQSDFADNKPIIEGMKRFSHEAMATTFEVVVIHKDEKYARQAIRAAFNEVDRLEAELSRFIENSEISRINNLPANKPLLLSLDAFECLKISCQLYTETNGAFDVTIGPLLSCWRNKDGTPRNPTEQELSLARSQTGSNLLMLNEEEHTIELLSSPVQIDLGGVGKGYAVDRMAEFLQDWSIQTVLISGGYSSVLALDAPIGTNGWPLSISNPENRKQILAKPHLKGRAIASSGLKKGQHIIDPRTGRPAQGKAAAWSSTPETVTADALSTAFMVMQPEEIERYCSLHPDTAAMIMLAETDKEADEYEIIQFGPWKEMVLGT